MGLVSIPSSVLLIGGLYGLVGVILAVVHLSRERVLRTLAWWGLGLSIIGVVATLGFGALYYQQVIQFQDTMGMLEEQSFDEWIGQPAPDFTVKDLQGNEITLSSLKGKRVILDFWATWCPPCRIEIPHFVKLSNTYDANDLVIIGISQESSDTLESFREKKRVNYTLAIEGTLPSPYADVTSLPTTFFIDRGGIIRYVVTGYRKYEHLDGLVQSLDQKQEPNEPNSI